MKRKMHIQSCMRLSRVCDTEDTNVGIRDRISSVASAEYKENQHYLRIIFLNMRDIAGQGLDLRGKEESSSNFINMLENMIEGTGKTFNLCQGKIKYFSSTIENEIIQFFYRQIMRKIV